MMVDIWEVIGGRMAELYELIVHRHAVADRVDVYIVLDDPLNSREWL